MKRQCILLIFLLICLLSAVQGAEIVYWLRGSDLTTIIEGQTHYIISSSVPTSSSTKTNLGLTTEKGINELGRWYSSPIPTASTISETAYLWLGNANITNDSADYRFFLYDFDQKTAESRLIAQSDWFSFPKNEQKEIPANLANYTMPAGHLLELVIEYNAKNGDGRIDFVVDESNIAATTVWKSSTGREFTIRGVSRTAALLLSKCQEIECNSNRECDDDDATTTDRCTNPGKCSSECIHERCAVECVVDYDCDDGSYLTTDKCVGRGTCDVYCSNKPCSVACSQASDCSDLNSGTRDICVNPATCLSYCIHEECEPDSCTGDSEEEYCGNGLCEYGEVGECPEDCQDELSISLIGILPGEYFLRGDTLLLKAKIDSDRLEPLGAIVKASGFFGETMLLDDGRHSDGNATDNIYANEIKITDDIENGVLPVTFEATYTPYKASLLKNYIIIPELEIDLTTDKETYYIGGTVLLNGLITRKNVPLSASVTLSLIAGGETVFERDISSNDRGLFSLQYRSSLSSPPGGWVVKARATDESNNQGSAEKQITFVSAEHAQTYQLKLVEIIKESYERGEDIGLSVEIRDEKDALVEGAEVSIASASGRTIQLIETSEGKYSGKFHIEWEAPTGMEKYNITALKTSDGSTNTGSISFSAETRPAEFNILLLDPWETNHQTGDELLLKIKLAYPDGTAVRESSTTATIGGTALQLAKSGPGLFTAHYTIGNNETGEIMLEINSTDPYGNSGRKTARLFVSRALINYYLRKYWFTLSVLCIIVATIIWATATIFTRKRMLAKSREKEKKLLKKIKQLQKRYFKDGTLKREVYYKLLNKYESELDATMKKEGGKLE